MQMKYVSYDEILKFYISKYGSNNPRKNDEKAKWNKLEQSKILSMTMNISSYLISNDDPKVKDNIYKKIYQSIIKDNNSNIPN